MRREDIRNLIELAIKARENSYSPYSKFAVGAAVLTDCGKVFTGCNCENISHSAAMCAERAALYSAVSAGCRSFKAIALAAKDIVSPCGICRQVLAEFGDIKIISANERGEYKEWMLSELLPEKFNF